MSHDPVAAEKVNDEILRRVMRFAAPVTYSKTGHNDDDFSSGMPRFGSLGGCVSIDAERSLWELEAKRLLRDAQRPLSELPPMFPMTQGEELVSEASLTELGKDADVLHHALQIWLAEDEVVHSIHSYIIATDSLSTVLEELGAIAPGAVANDKLEASPRLAMEVGLHLNREANKAPPAPTQGHQRGTLACSWEREGGIPLHQESISFTQVANLVSIITPLAFAKPYVAKKLKQAVQALAELSEMKEMETRSLAQEMQKISLIQRATSGWEIDEASVTVRCLQYSLTISFICLIMVALGLTSAFTLGESIEGVDLFNIATFTWVLAGFVVLVSKAHRVSGWPWHDFLHDRFRCRSVEELRRVTGLKSQDVLFFLLSWKRAYRLETKGPYNRPFRLKRSEGFSIDIPIQLETLLACGVVPLKVSGVEGSLLVFLDLITRTGKEAGMASVIQSQSSRYIQQSKRSWDWPKLQMRKSLQASLNCCAVRMFPK
ncbi:hypothetical protein PspLS_00921 [Pyricularia sp. CBS 133598]|nr:hypothetical protein PspLS_00921 [Pyricularia sp. CBS 133598]